MSSTTTEDKITKSIYPRSVPQFTTSSLESCGLIRAVRSWSKNTRRELMLESSSTLTLTFLGTPLVVSLAECLPLTGTHASNLTGLGTTQCRARRWYQQTVTPGGPRSQPPGGKRTPPWRMPIRSTTSRAWPVLLTNRRRASLLPTPETDLIRGLWRARTS